MAGEVTNEVENDPTQFDEGQQLYGPIGDDGYWSSLRDTFEREEER